MMMKNRKKVALLCGALLGFSCAFCGAITQKTVSANESPLTMLGASVRLDENQGIRFTAEINGEPTEGSTYHVMIMPATWRTDTNHNLQSAENGDYYAHLISKGLTDVDNPETPNVDERDFINLECEPVYIDVDEDGKEEWVVRGTIKEVKYNNTNRQFFGVAYEEKTDGTRVYADNQEKGVRSCTYVAGAALDSGDYANDATKTGYLNNMINNAYNRVVLGKNEHDEQVDAIFALPEVSAYNPVGTELQFSVSGTDGLDLPAIEWNVQKTNDSKSIFDDNNKLVVFDETGRITVSTKVAGKDLVANVDCGTYLETFTANADNIKVDNQFRDSSTPGTWLESLTDSTGATEYGVGMGSTTWTGSNGSIALRFNKTESQLKEIFNDPNFQSITFRVLIKDGDASGNMTIKFFDIIERKVAEDAWTNVTLTKADIFENETLLNEFLDKQGIIDGIAKNFNADGCGYMKGKNVSTNRRLTYVPNNNATNPVARELYVADIEYAFGESVYLETFATNADNIKNANQFNASATAGVWLESLTDESGVTKYGVGMGSTKYTGNGSDGIALRFNKTESELKKILSDDNFESITFRVLLKDEDANGTMNINFFDLINRQVTENIWTNVTITKADIFENETLLTEFVNKQGIIDGIAKNFNAAGCGYMKGNNATTNRRLVYVPNNNASPLVARELYVADIECSFGTDTYLETFSATSNGIRSAGQFSETNGTAGAWLDSYTDMRGITEYGVGKATRDSGGRICVRFDKTEDELRAILNNANFEKITFRMLVKATNVADGDSISFKFLNTVSKNVTANQWVDVDLTKEEILNSTLVSAFGSEAKIIDSANGSLYGFVNGFSSSGIGYIQLSSASGNAAYRMIHTSVAGFEVYIDHITYSMASAN